MTARWEEALDAQLDLYLYAQSERGRRYMLGWSWAEEQPDGTSASDMVPIALPKSAVAAAVRPNGIYARTADRVAATAFKADTFSVEEDMQTLWEAAIPSFMPEPLQATDLLTDTGFLYLPRPSFLTDKHGKKTTFRAIAWSRLDWEWDNGKPASGVLLYLFHRVGDPDDYDLNDESDKLLAEARRSGMLRVNDLLVDFVLPWEFGFDYATAHRNAAPKYDGHSTMVPQVVQTLWRLLSQHISVKEKRRSPKPTRRRFKKANVPERDIVVVRLRRPASDRHSEEHSIVEWSHRWLVEGHWRNQWFPSLGMHRQIRISPYIKGPDDKELIVRKARVFDWDR